jgi:RNA polymerase sigma factor FliA
MAKRTTTDPTLDLWRRYKRSPNDRRRNELIEVYLPLVRIIAQRLFQSLTAAVDRADLVQAGVFGLMQAIEAYEPKRGIKFESFAPLRIKGAMLDSLRAGDWVPRLARLQAAKLNRAREEAEQAAGGKVDDVAIAGRLGLDLEGLRELTAKARVIGLATLERKLHDIDSHKEVRLREVLADRRGEDPQAPGRRRDVLCLACRGMKREQRLLLILYYWEGATMKEIGRHLGLSESRISRMHSELLLRLRDRLEGRRHEFVA